MRTSNDYNNSDKNYDETQVIFPLNEFLVEI